MGLVSGLGLQKAYSLKATSVLLLSKYGRLGASTRVRTLQYLTGLEQTGLQISVHSLISDDALFARYQRGRYSVPVLLCAYFERVRKLIGRHNFDVVWIEKESLPWWPLWIERFLLRGVPYVLDYDDADFHNYDLHRWAWVRQIYGRRLDGLMSGATLVVAGNEYLALRARAAGAPRVEVVPTVIDLERYSCIPQRLSPKSFGKPRIVWIGSPCTVHYIQSVRESLAQLAKQAPFVLRVIGGGAIAIPGVQIELVDWAEATEVQEILGCDIGIMPLLNTPWEQGKCGYKLIQYMACGLPTVASNVGVNPEIVQDGMTGFLASTPDDWVSALASLLADGELRHTMGRAGRLRVEEKYCVQQTGPRLANLLSTCPKPI